jgi:hypothetical protein
MYDELVKSIHYCFGFDSQQADCENCMMKDKREKYNYIGCCDALGLAAADAIEELMEFARFVAEEVVVDDNEWGNNQSTFPEIACRMLFKLGIVSKDGDMWHYEPPKGE